MATFKNGNVSVTFADNYTPSDGQTVMYNAIGRNSGFNPLGWVGDKINSAENAIGTTISAGVDFARSGLFGGTKGNGIENITTENMLKRQKESIDDVYRKYGFNGKQDFDDQLYSAERSGDQAEADRLLHIAGLNDELKGVANTNATEAKNKANAYQDYRKNSYIGQKVNQNNGKFAGSALNTLSTMADIAGMATGAPFLMIPNRVIGNGIQGAIGGVANELEQNGGNIDITRLFDKGVQTSNWDNFDWGRAGQNALIGGASGLASGAFNNLINGKNFIGGSGDWSKLANKAIQSQIGRGALSGAVGGAVGGGLGAGLNSGDWKQGALQGAGQGALSGAVNAGVMQGATKLGGAVLNKVNPELAQKIADNQKMYQNWRESGKNFNERLTNTLNSGESGIGNWLNRKTESKFLKRIGEGGVGLSIKPVGNQADDLDREAMKFGERYKPFDELYNDAKNRLESQGIQATDKMIRQEIENNVLSDMAHELANGNKNNEVVKAMARRFASQEMNTPNTIDTQQLENDLATADEQTKLNTAIDKLNQLTPESLRHALSNAGYSEQEFLDLLTNNNAHTERVLAEALLTGNEDYINRAKQILNLQASDGYLTRNNKYYRDELIKDLKDYNLKQSQPNNQDTRIKSLQDKIEYYREQIKDAEAYGDSGRVTGLKDNLARANGELEWELTHRAQGTQGAGSQSVRDWYMKNYADDELGGRINQNLTFDQLKQALQNGAGGDIYNTIGVEDSVIRERLFDQLVNQYGGTYDDYYNQWLEGGNGTTQGTVKDLLESAGIKPDTTKIRPETATQQQAEQFAKEVLDWETRTQGKEYTMKNGNGEDVSVNGLRALEIARAYRQRPQELIQAFANASNNLRSLPDNLNIDPNIDPQEAINELIAIQNKYGLSLNSKPQTEYPQTRAKTDISVLNADSEQTQGTAQRKVTPYNADTVQEKRDIARTYASLSKNSEPVDIADIEAVRAMGLDPQELYVDTGGSRARFWENAVGALEADPLDTSATDNTMSSTVNALRGSATEAEGIADLKNELTKQYMELQKQVWNTTDPTQLQQLEAQSKSIMDEIITLDNQMTDFVGDRKHGPVQTTQGTQTSGADRPKTIAEFKEKYGSDSDPRFKLNVSNFKNADEALEYLADSTNVVGGINGSELERVFKKFPQLRKSYEAVKQEADFNGAGKTAILNEMYDRAHTQQSSEAEPKTSNYEPLSDEDMYARELTMNWHNGEYRNKDRFYQLHGDVNDFDNMQFRNTKNGRITTGANLRKNQLAKLWSNSDFRNFGMGKNNNLGGASSQDEFNLYLSAESADNLANLALEYTNYEPVNDWNTDRVNRMQNGGKTQSSEANPQTAKDWAKRAIKRIGEDLDNKGVGLSIKPVSGSDSPTPDETEVYRALVGGGDDGTGDDFESGYGQSKLATGETRRSNIFSRAGRALEGAQAGGTRKENRDIGIENAGDLINTVRKRTGISDIETQAQLARELTGGKDSLLDNIQRQALNATEDGSKRTVDLTDLNKPIEDLIYNASGVLLPDSEKQKLYVAVIDDLTNNKIDTIAKANNMRAVAHQLYIKDARTPDDSSRLKANILSEIAGMVEDKSYNAVPKDNVDAMFETAQQEALSRAKVATQNGKKNIAKAYTKLANEIAKTPHTIGDFRHLKKDFVDISKLYTKTSQGATAWNSYSNNAVIGSAIAGAFLSGNPLTAIPTAVATKMLAPAIGESANTLGAKVGGKIADFGDMISDYAVRPTTPATDGQTVLYNALGRENGLNSTRLPEENNESAYVEQAPATVTDNAPVAVLASGNNVASDVYTPSADETSVYDSLTNSGTTTNGYTRPSLTTPQVAGNDFASMLERAMQSASEAGDAQAFGTLYQMYQNATSKNSSDMTNPVNWNSADRTKLINAQNGLSQIDTLANAYANATGNGGDFVSGNLRNFGNMISGGNLDPTASNYNDLAQSVGMAIIKNLVNLGVTESDAERYKQYLPALTDSAEKAQMKLETLRQLYQDQINNLYSTYGM